MYKKRFTIRPWMVVLALVVLFAAALGITYFADRNQSKAEALVGDGAAPGQEAANTAAGGIGTFFARLFSSRDIDEDYEALKLRVISLETQLAQMEEVQRENDRMFELFGYAGDYPEYEYIPARVISRDPGGWITSFNINVGERQGVAMDMSVVCEDGLVGRIVQVGANWAQVLCIIDPSCAVPILVERTRDQATIKGMTRALDSSAVCEVLYLNSNAELTPGDRLITSNLGGIYPKGVSVGRILEVGKDASNRNYALMQPYVDFARIENVLVIKGERPGDYEAQDDAQNQPPEDEGGEQGAA